MKYFDLTCNWHAFKRGGGLMIGAQFQYPVPCVSDIPNGQPIWGLVFTLSLLICTLHLFIWLPRKD